MLRTSKIVVFCVCVLILPLTAAAQKKDRVEVAAKIPVAAVAKDCQDLKAGRVLSVPKLVYPAEAKFARVGGTVSVTVQVDEKGKVSEISDVSGQRLLQSAASDAARKTKFSPTVCGGSATPAVAILTYNFIAFVHAESYFAPAKIEEFADLKTDSPYYEAVLNLTENYQFAFGYEDKKFYADAPLVRGDFAQYLRLTLDLLAERAAVAKKVPREIGLFNSYNPQKLLSVNSIKDLKAKDPFYDSVKTLLLKYDIAITNDRSEFQGNLYLTNNEVIDWWSRIFGADSIPVNFARLPEDGDRIISRGEFALFLQESLQVLTYKVLP